MSVKVMARVWAHSQRKDGELLTLLALADFANDQGECWPSIPVLAQKARLTERQTRRVLIKLEEAREIRRVVSSGGRNHRNRYFITVNENPDNITGKELQGKNYPVIGDTKTLVPVSGALNHHRTINKSKSANARESSSNKRSKKLTRPDPAALAAFDGFYLAYPRHVDRIKALQAWTELNPTPELVGVIMAAMERYAAEVQSSEAKYIKHPATWLNAKPWTDEPQGGNGHAAHVFKDLGDGTVEYNGLKMTRKDYERRYERANAARA